MFLVRNWRGTKKKKRKKIIIQNSYQNKKFVKHIQPHIQIFNYIFILAHLPPKVLYQNTNTFIWYIQNLESTKLLTHQINQKLKLNPKIRIMSISTLWHTGNKTIIWCYRKSKLSWRFQKVSSLVLVYTWYIFVIIFMHGLCVADLLL